MRFPPPFATTALLLLVTSVAMPGSATPPTATNLHPTITISMDDTNHDVEILRCHFSEGRIVVRFAGELHVLRKGDRMGESSLRVVEITLGSATLAIQQSATNPGSRIVRITRSERGSILLREYASDPAVLSTDPAATDTTRIRVGTNPSSTRLAQPGTDDSDGSKR